MSGKSPPAAPPAEPTEQSADARIEVDDEALESDSAYGDELSNYSTSLASSVKDFQFKHGRRYHSYQAGSYQFPNDEPEQERLDMFHHIVNLSLDGKLHLAPFNPEGARVLDIGTGTGIWAIDMGDLYPQAELILGNDLSPIQPSWVPPNVKFVVDDAESDWVPIKPYDYIHARYLSASISDWPRLVKQCYDHLTPGGWVEFHDVDGNPHSEDGSTEMTPKYKPQEMMDLLAVVCEKSNKVLQPGGSIKKWLEDAGFINVKYMMKKLPIGTWPKDKTLVRDDYLRMDGNMSHPFYDLYFSHLLPNSKELSLTVLAGVQKEIGAFMALQCTEGVEAFTTYPFTQVLGWSKEEVEVFCAQLRADVKRRDVHALCPMHYVIGQKPEKTEA
ncbi:hypothetical protein FQN52_009174 [Onygenales sp. PD_12]|nr:hypothetical protein FQN52_009174 [Onygenales sp. PD_12]